MPIVVIDAGSLAPDDAITTVLKKYSKGSGLLVPTNEGVLEMQNDKDAYTSMEAAMEEINNLQIPLKEMNRIFFFTNYPDKMLDDDIQPFICIADETEKGPDPMLAAFIEGDLDEDFEPDASGHSREYMAVNTYLAVKLQRLYAQVGNDLEDFLKLLEDPLLKKEMLGTLFDGTGNLVMVAATGEVLILAHKSPEKSFDWGWMSDPCGYGEFPETKPLDKGVVDAGKSVLANLKAKGVLAVAKAGLVAATAPIKPDTTKDNSEMVWARPPKHIKESSNNKRKSWYEARVSVVPENWKMSPSILMTRERALKEGCEIVQPPVTDKPADTTTPDKKDVAPHHIPPHVDSTTSPLISNKQQEYIVDEFLKTAEIKKLLDANSQDIPDPTKDEESKYPTFCEKAGLPGLESTLRWSYASLIPLFRKAPEAAALLYLNTRAAYVNQLREKPKAVAPAPTTVGPATIAIAPKRKRL